MSGGSIVKFEVLSISKQLVTVERNVVFIATRNFFVALQRT